MTLQLAIYYVSSHASACYFFNKTWWRHQSTLTGRTTATVLIPKTCHREVQVDCLDCDILFGKELCLFHLNQQHKFFIHSHVARHEKRENFLDNFHPQNFNRENPGSMLNRKIYMPQEFWVYGTIFTQLNIAATITHLTWLLLKGDSYYFRVFQ